MNTLAGRYQVTQTLGGGGFAITFLAHDILQPSKPLCVVKQLLPNQSHPRVVEFFEKEAAILERLGKHPQIPQLLAHFSENQNLYIVQEFIQGQDLSQEIIPGKPLNEGYVTELLQDILEVLSFVHSQGVIHRDIKPQNLMRRHQDGKIFLIDFGAVKELGTLMVNTQGEVSSSIVIGTPGYMPNEQRNGKPCLGSDVYAVGMTVIQALTGVLPFNLPEDPFNGEIIWRNQAQVSDGLAEVLTKMVRRHYSLRYANALEVLQALTPAPSSAPTAETLPVFTPALPASTAKTLPVFKPAPVPATLPEPKLSRRRIIQTVGLMAAGFGLAIVGERQFFSSNLGERNSSNSKEPEPNPSISNKPVFPVQSFEFEVVTVDTRGKISNRSHRQAKYISEDLGNSVTLEMVQIPGGTFMMGSPAGEEKRDRSEDSQHQVKVAEFYLGKYEVTQVQYQAIMGKNPSTFKGKQRPVEQVTWNNAVEFCKRLSQKTGRTYRLPSEAEWEYACRGGTTTPFYFGETITTDFANYRGTDWDYQGILYPGNYGSGPKGKFREQTTDVGTFPANSFGLFDMHGNLWEWCQDEWHENYNRAPVEGSAWLNGNTNRVLRGGSWYYGSGICRSAYRRHHSPEYKDNDVGFRVVCEAAIASNL